MAEQGIELYIVRHGLAGEHGSYANDNERPLTEEGVRKTRKVAKQLKEFGLKFDLIQTSPLVRAKQTAEILQAIGLGKSLEEFAELAPGGNFEQWINWLQGWGASQEARKGNCLAIVGHEPDLSDWAQRLVWGEARQQIVLKKAGVIGIQLPTEGSPIGRSELFWLTPPKFLIAD
ncbi:phosphohistidine phosphatase SixA [Leptolyngbya ohadii]|uniref:phosphohistidine phosphatase SixA n=1 Tax=Leptolyngbya ohadii TaxID=1962290 RepID=UPI000B59C009|nr:phosphohistidine phosphatase SixA [Leptolyngbya ohadii]